MGDLVLRLQRQRLIRDAGRHNVWDVITEEVRVPPERIAVILCDVWDNHWSRGAVERLELMLPRMNALVKVARDVDSQIIHAPSETMGFYEGTPARERIQSIPAVEPPEYVETLAPILPVDTSGGSSDTGEDRSYKAWTRQHPGIEIDQDRDVISDDGREVYSLLVHRKIEWLLIMGVHTNMCILNRSFAIKQMVHWGVQIALIRDLTDAMYDPAMPPYVSHEAGTKLVVAYIEKFWCPTVLSRDLF